MKCDDCGTPVSGSLDYCPECGEYQKQPHSPSKLSIVPGINTSGKVTSPISLMISSIPIIVIGLLILSVVVGMTTVPQEDTGPGSEPAGDGQATEPTGGNDMDDDTDGDEETEKEEQEPTPEPELELDVRLSEDEIPVRNSVEISTDIINSGDATGSVGMLELQRNGEPIMTEEIGEIEAGDTRTISHVYEFEEGGTFTISALTQNGLELEVSETLSVRDDSYYADMIENTLQRHDDVTVDRVYTDDETVHVSFISTAFSMEAMGDEIKAIAAAYTIAMEEGWDGMSGMEIREVTSTPVLVWEVESDWIESWSDDELDDDELVRRIMNTVGI